MADSNVRTLHSAVATIKFSGGVDSADSSSSDSEDAAIQNRLQQDELTVISQDAAPAQPTQNKTDGSGADNVTTDIATLKGPPISPPQRFNPFDKEDFDPNEKVFPQLQDASPSGRLNSTASSEDSWPDETPSPEQENPVPQLGLAENHFEQEEDEFGQSSEEELKVAINQCKLLILSCGENSPRRHSLVARLVQLRLRLEEAKEGPGEQEPGVKVVVGHQFEEKDSRRTKHYCEKCNGVIWGVLHGWYRCKACGFCCHSKCLNLITRTCASAKVAENPIYILSICPEKGLDIHNYKCAECKTPISYQAGFGEPRQCDYSGSYYCQGCHWNDTAIIPARVLHNWDFEPRKVCRASKQYLRLMVHKPVIRVQDINPMLFSFVEELNDVKKLREEILIMKKYFVTCKAALGSKLLLQLSERQHFVESSDLYSLADLMDVASDSLLPRLAKIHASFAQHIKTDCQRCQGQGYICELCDYEEVLFPFDNHALVCAQCSTVLHRHCYMRRNQRCPKCERLSKRSQEEL